MVVGDALANCLRHYDGQNLTPEIAQRCIEASFAIFKFSKGKYPFISDISDCYHMNNLNIVEHIMRKAGIRCGQLFAKMLYCSGLLCCIGLHPTSM